MAAKFISLRNLKFLIYEVFDVDDLTKHEYYSQHNHKIFDMVLDAAMKLSVKLLYPTFEEMDRKPPEFDAGSVKVHPSVRELMKQFGEGGWIASTFPEKFDGEQLPALVANCCNMMFSAANYSGGAYPGLTSGAARLITNFGNPDLIDRYVAKMLSGQWQGTMALTEPQAGSSLSDITTMAEPSDAGHYFIKGQKIFISAGDHDGVDNVVHLMLAKIPGGPPGVKGISLFVVPKYRFDDKKKLVPNDIVVSQIYHKMGYRGCPITELAIGEKDDCHGYLVGEAHKGLFYMFQMMNEERVGVGLAAASIASAAYYAALEYALERPQGRPISSKDPQAPQVPIAAHADVKRMLLFQRAIVEGSFSLLLQCSRYEDMTKLTTGEEKEACELLLDLLTPVAKTYSSEMGILSTSQSIQCFGGYGYCEDFPVEQYFRDMRIHPIHEGTTGIQGMDLLGRKVIMKDGKAFRLFGKTVRETIAAAEPYDELASHAAQLAEELESLENVTLHLVGVAGEKGPAVFLADATLYLELFSYLAIGWQWLLQAISVQKAMQGNLSKSETNFYQGKWFTFRYFFEYELPKAQGVTRRLKSPDALTVDMQPEFFND
jgi:alkylation response protein AidB-like acyl-CoA dehydrogenase